jgi:hypothetical protein
MVGWHYRHGDWRDLQLFSIRFRSSDSRDTFRCPQCFNRVYEETIFLQLKVVTNGTSNRAILGSYFLGETLGVLGKIGCAICLLGSVIIVLHAPPDPEIETIDQILDYAIQPGFLFYCTITTIFAVIMIYKVAPKYGKKNPLIYLSICSTVGSISIMAIKAFGIAVKLTLGGKNQFTHASTYVFLIVVVVCILTQMNYFNKALSQFNTNMYVSLASSP